MRCSLTPTSSHSSSESLAATARPAMATAAVLEVRSGPTGRGAGLAVREDARRRTGSRVRAVMVTRQLVTEKCALTHNAVAVHLSNYQKRTRVIISVLRSLIKVVKQLLIMEPVAG